MDHKGLQRGAVNHGAIRMIPNHIPGCMRCRAFQEFDVYPSTHPLRGKLYVVRERACVCGGNFVADTEAGYGAERQCETEGCRKLARHRFCLSCSSQRQADTERNRTGQRDPDAPLPKCACGVQLTHWLSRNCRDCKRRKNTEQSREYFRAKRDAA